MTVGKYCIHCGLTEPEVEFRSTRAMKCTACDADFAKERKEYHRLYHQARGRALQALVDEHPERFEELLTRERAAQQKRQG